MKFIIIITKCIILATFISFMFPLRIRFERDGDNKKMTIAELRKKNQLEKTIKPELKMNVPQSFLGTCSGTKAKEFSISTWGIETCVGLSYYNDCGGNTFSMLTHLDAGHTTNLESYISSFVSTIPANCPKNSEKIEISTTFSSDKNLINKLKSVLSSKFASTSISSKEYVSKAGLDVAIKTSDGTVKQYGNLSVEQPTSKTAFGSFSNIQSECNLYYLGPKRMCHIKESFDIAVKDFKNNKILKIDSAEAVQGKGTFTYAFQSSATAANSEPNTCNNSDL
jgi:hypothetical protein